MTLRLNPITASVAIWSALLAACLLYRQSLFLGSGEESIVGLVPDDAFYYLVLAKRFAVDHRWSLDGIHPATGFQLLHGYFLAAIFEIRPAVDLDSLVAFVTLLQSVMLIVAFAAVLQMSAKTFGVWSGVGALAVFASVPALTMTSMLMESGWVILFGAIAFALVRGESSCFWTAFAVGTLGTLARVDFVVLTCTLGLFELTLYYLRYHIRHDRPEGSRLHLTSLRSTSLALVAGSLAGLALVGLHTHLISGAWLQSSVRIKSHWSVLQGFRLQSASTMTAQLFPSLRFLRAPLALGVIGVLLTGIFLWRRRGTTLASPDKRLLLSSLAVAAAYLLAYGKNGGSQQLWYLAPVLVPIALFGGAMTSLLSRWSLLLVVLLGVASPGRIARSLEPAWPHQTAMKQAARRLGHEGPHAHLGAWNAGILSYFSGATITNLDGLVNDSIYPYVVDDKLVEYLVREGIRYIVDFQAMIDRPEFQARGGYPCNRLGRHLQHQSTLSDGSAGSKWLGTDLVLYRFSARPPVATRAFTGIDFSAAGNSREFIGCGWSTPESWGTWTVGDRAELFLLVPEPHRSYWMELEADPFVNDVHPKMEMEVFANEASIGRHRFESGRDAPDTLRFLIPERSVEDGPWIAIEIHIDAPVSPKNLGLSADPRELGLAVKSLRLSARDGPHSAEKKVGALR